MKNQEKAVKDSVDCGSLILVLSLAVTLDIINQYFIRC